MQYGRALLGGAIGGAPSRAVLRRHGNMSSATILFVLEEALRTRPWMPAEWGLMIGLGPGFAAEGALVQGAL